ncbi:hypothetical protein TSMEX_009291 [Taenia solium]|eukprot:TsM_001093700 transcript=TsM_001093700 gene=TsM_001093700
MTICGPSRRPTSLTLQELQSVRQKVKSHNKKITDLCQDLVEILCKYLSAVDMINACTAIPSWEWILFLPMPYSYINKRKWINRRAHTIQYSDVLIPRTADICKFVEQSFG